MRSFISDKKHSNSNDISISPTNSYFEVEIPLDQSSAMVVYLIPRSTSSLFVVSCWEHAFDQILGDVDEDDWDTIVDTWPTLAKLCHNGANDRYREGALIRFEDPDDGEDKWFIASISGNHDLENIDDILDERTQQSIQLVLECSTCLMQELQANKPSMLRAFGRGLTKGVVATLGAIALGLLGISAE